MLFCRPSRRFSAASGFGARKIYFAFVPPFITSRTGESNVGRGKTFWGRQDVSFFDHGGIIVYSTRIRGALISFALAAGIVALASGPAIGATRQIPSSGAATLQAG